ncbi:MAG: hypothetical protein WD042_07040 [Phycisphaeraceae bacterium]
MSRPIIARMQRYHRHRWFFYAAWGWATLWMLFWFSGWAGTAVTWWRDPHFWAYVPEDWADYPVVTFLGLADLWNYYFYSSSSWYPFAPSHRFLSKPGAIEALAGMLLNAGFLALLLICSRRAVVGVTRPDGTREPRQRIDLLSGIALALSAALSSLAFLFALAVVAFMGGFSRSLEQLLDPASTPGGLPLTAFVLWLIWASLAWSLVWQTPLALVVLRWTEAQLVVSAAVAIVIGLWFVGTVPGTARPARYGGEIGFSLFCMLPLYASLTSLILMIHRWPIWRGLVFDATYCLACGYDLTGTRAAGRTVCPECGAACGTVQTQDVVDSLA